MTKKQHSILIFVGTLLILCYASVGLFCHPSGDDFSYAVLGNNGNFLETVLDERQRWNGRYISNFLVLFSPLNWGGFYGYKLMSIILIGCIFSGTSFFFKMVLGKYHILFALTSTLLTFSIMPDITEGIYWYTGAWTYIPGGLLFLMSLSVLLKYWGNLKTHHYLIAFFLFFIASGFNEIIPLLGIVVFGTLFIKNRKEIRVVFFLTLFISLLVYILLAPGNSVRADHFPDKNQLFYSLFMSTAYTIRFIGEWVLNPALFFWGILILKIDFKNEYTNKLAFLKNPFFAFISIVTPTFIGCFGPIWSTGLLGQYRTSNLASYLFVLTFILLVIANKEYIKSKLKFAFVFKHTFLIVVLFLILWKNQFFMFKELLNGDIYHYNQFMYKRYDIINTCEKSDCAVPAIKNKSKTLFVYPLTNNPEHWKNKSYQLYFKSGRILKDNKTTN